MASAGQFVTIKLMRSGQDSPWGFRLQGGREFQLPLSVIKVSYDRNIVFYTILSKFIRSQCFSSDCIKFISFLCLFVLSIKLENRWNSMNSFKHTLCRKDLVGHRNRERERHRHNL